MARSNVTDTTATQVETGYIRKILVTSNTALTGTVKIIDNTAGTVANVATITNPGVGSQYEYWNFMSGVRIIASGTCDLTIQTDGSYGPH